MKEEETKKEPLPGIMGMCAETLGPGGVMKKKVHPDEPRRQQPSDGEIIRELDTSLIDEWEMVDRHMAEFGDMDSLIEQITDLGQRIPALVRPKDGGRFELIYGRRRLTACREIGIKLKAVVKKIDDQEAFLEMFVENSGREDVSTWTKAMSIKRALDSGIYKNQSALATKLNISRSHLTNLMAYTRIPEAVSDAIGPMHRVGVDMAVKLAKLTEDPSTHERLIELAPQIASGKLSARGIEKALQEDPDRKESPFTAIRDGDEVIGKLHKTKSGDIQITINPDAARKHSQKTLGELLDSAGVFGQKQG